MSTMDLFLRKPELEFAKTALTEKAAAVDVDEDSANWTRQILAELYKTIPEIAEYSATVIFHRRDDKQGYALAGVLLDNSTDSALAATRIGGRKAVKAVVPAVIKQYQLLPMDILIGPKGKMLPLTPDRLREALFRPDTFEAITHDWGDSSLYNLFYPPGRTGSSDVLGGVGTSLGGSGSTNYVMGPGMKYASEAEYTMLDAILPTIIRPDIARVATAMEDVATKLAAERNEVLLMALAKVASVEDEALNTTNGPIQQLAYSTVGADVVQLGYSDDTGKYWVKSASRVGFYNAPEVWLDRGEMIKFAGEDTTKKIDTEGTVTVAKPTVEDPEADPSASKWGVVAESGIYKVRTTAGKELMGWVLPNLLDLDGTRMPLSVFTNGAVSMTQDQVYGARIATGVDLPSDPIQGTGVFYCAGQGGVEATVPVKIVGKEAGMDGSDVYHVQSMTGVDARAVITPGMATMRALEGEFFLPASARFIAIDDGDQVPLVGEAKELDKTAAHVLFDAEHAHVTARALEDGRFKVAFRNAPKLAQAVLGFAPGNGPFTHPGGQQDGTLDVHGAAWLMCVAGASPKLAYAKLAEAQHTGQVVDVMGHDVVSTAAERHKQASAATAEVVAKVANLRMSLVKEAAAMPDAMTVDAVLSLGFINPENLRLFVGRLPYLEKALSMICECVLAARLGLSPIPEGAASRAARSLDAVITGLRGLSLFDMGEST